MTSGCGRTFAWTAEGRLSSVTVGGQTTTFDYNAAGQLVKKTAAGATHYFLWDGGNLLAELDSVGPARIAEYSYYPGLDNPHALVVGTTKYFAHADGVGNVIALTDTAQQLSRTYRYWAWGENTGGGVDYANLNGKDRARFKGALWFGDAGGTDLYYMRNRWYDPGTGRFLSEDPIGLAGGINPYTFGASDPVNRLDPAGQDPWIVNGVMMDCYELDFGALGYSMSCKAFTLDGVLAFGDIADPLALADDRARDPRPGSSLPGCIGGLDCATSVPAYNSVSAECKWDLGIFEADLGFDIWGIGETERGAKALFGFGRTVFQPGGRGVLRLAGQRFLSPAAAEHIEGARPALMLGLTDQAVQGEPFTAGRILKGVGQSLVPFSSTSSDWNRTMDCIGRP